MRRNPEHSKWLKTSRKGYKRKDFIVTNPVLQCSLPVQTDIILILYKCPQRHATLTKYPSAPKHFQNISTDSSEIKLFTFLSFPFLDCPVAFCIKAKDIQKSNQYLGNLLPERREKDIIAERPVKSP